MLSNQEPDGIVQAPAGMVVTKCGDVACTVPGPGSSYSLRLADGADPANVNVSR